MIQYRTARQEENAAILQMANDVFHGIGDPIVFETALPKVYGKNVDFSPWHSIAVEDALGIRGIVATLPETLHIGEETLKIGYIGTVSVHPDARGEGHMKKLMELSKKKAVQDGLDFLILGGQRQRYAYFGFENAGLYYQSLLSASNVKHALTDCQAEQVSFEEILPNTLWESKAKALHQAQWFYAERAPFAIHCQSYYAKPFAAVEKGVFLGYFVQMEGGCDMSEMVAVSEEAERKIIKAWLQKQDIRQFFLTTPGWNIPQMRRMAAIAEYTQMGTNARISVIRWKNTVEKLLRLKAMGCRLTDGNMELNLSGEIFTVVVRDGMLSVSDGAGHPTKLESSDAERMMFDPFAMETQGNWFPLPIFLPQADSF